MSAAVIYGEGLGKRYRRGLAGDPGLRHALDRFVKSPLSAFRRKKDETFWALKDVSLEVKEGEVLGLIGRNGAGKTTLLKILSRITKPTTGWAEIRGRDGDLAPLEIRGGSLRAIDYALPVPSAQVKSAILLAGLYADGATAVRESVRTRDHTELALREFGATVETTKDSIRIQPRPKLVARQLTVPGDLSGGVFLACAALILPDSSLMLHNVGLNATRAKVLDFLISIGAQINIASVQLRDGELIGDLSVKYSQLSGGSIAGQQVAEMIDELPMLAALGAYTEKGIEIHDAAELRVKESDRIATLAAGLRQMGADVEEFPDGLRVAGRSAGQLRGAKVDPQGDHRIAMALSVAALGAEGDTVIRDAECVGVSFPEFFVTLERLRGLGA